MEELPDRWGLGGLALSICYVNLAGCGLSLLKHKGWLDFQRLEELPDRWGLGGLALSMCYVNLVGRGLSLLK
ncbi:MAG: hypothetical protein PVH65_13810, partial [Chloroflexota bacterium]